MKVHTLKASLLDYVEAEVRLVLPDGGAVPPEFHVTEVGHVVKNFIDCGGTVRRSESCLLQAWVSEKDHQHRLTAGKLAAILDLSKGVVSSEDLDVEVEYGAGAVAQFTIEEVRPEGDALRFQLGNRKTDCLARETCGVEQGASACGCGAGACC